MRNRSRQGAKPKEYWMYFKVERHSMGRFITRKSFKMKLVEQYYKHVQENGLQIVIENGHQGHNSRTAKDIMAGQKKS